MKIALVFPPFYLSTLYNLPPLGLLNLATVLREAGHEVIVLDLVLAIRRNILPLGGSIYDESVKMILNESPDLVGFSVQCTTFPAVIQITELLRKRKPALRIVLGGHDVSFVDQRTLERFPWIDAVIRGEGEITMRALAAAYAKGRNTAEIAGVTWREDGKVIRNRDRDLVANLDDLPIPDYSFIPSLATYRDACNIPRSIAILEVGRGCPHQCVYCSESIMWRRRTRTFSISRIIEEMHLLRDHFGAECFLLAYDQFTANRQFVEDFCTTVVEEGLNDTPWYCISRLDSMDPPLLRLMREAGCESMCYGIDSGSKRTLAFIRKQIDETILFQRVRETTEEGLVPTLSFIVGFPEEGREDIDKTLSLALKTGIQGNSNPLLQLPTVLAGTEL
ncbi:MAG: radical SAM protein, partial [Geobacter sp.]